MLWTVIKKDRLNRHRNLVTKLDFLRKRKFEILNQFGLKAYDYSKIKVMAGNGKRTTDQERAVIALEKINKEIDELAAIVLPEQAEIEKQIVRLDAYSNDWRHSDILKRLYVDGESLKDVITTYYGEDTKTNRRSIEGLRDTAIKMLEKVSTKPFIEIQQTVIEDWK